MSEENKNINKETKNAKMDRDGISKENKNAGFGRESKHFGSDGENKSMESKNAGFGRNRRGRGPVEKPKDFKNSIRKLVIYCKPYGITVLIAVICDMLGVITKLIGPNKISDITNIITAGLIGEIDMERIRSICIFLMILYATGTLLSYNTSLLMTIITQKVNRGLRDSISKKINRLPVSYFQTTSTGDVLSRVTNDVDTIGQSLQNSIATLVSALTMFFGSIIMMFYTNAVMALTAIASSLIGFLFMSLITGRSQRYFTARQEWLGKMNGHVEEVYTGHSIVKLFNGEKTEKETFDRLNRKMYESNWKSQFLSGLMMPLMQFVGNFGYVAVCIVGAALAMNGKIEFGAIIAFMIYIRLFTNPLSQIAQSITNLQSTAAASERVFEFLEAEEMAEDSRKRQQAGTVRGEVEFKNVRFGYSPDKTIIKNFSEHILPGQKVAIVGPTGAGKTTLVNLLMKFNEVDGGEILIDGVPTSEISRSAVRDMFGMVLQDTWLFEGTVRENLCYGKDNIMDGQLDTACKAVGLYHFIKTLPHGYDTMIDDKLSLSAGQKQLMTIARAMIENAPMLILDEATSSVDTRTELLIQQAMDKLTEGRTSFVIAHRLSTIKNADLILVLRDGNIVESGTHEELLLQNGFYAQLYNSQFEAA